MHEQPDEHDQQLNDVEELVEDAAEGLWLRFRDIVLVQRKLERFVF
jgi:hypothetical protein